MTSKNSESQIYKEKEKKCMVIRSELEYAIPILAI